jgi:hypothetical protein
VEEDRKKLWDNQALQRSREVIGGEQLIDRLLHAGEKLAVFNKIGELSGFGLDLEEQAGN